MHVFRDAHATRNDPPQDHEGATVRARTRFPITERILKQEVQRDLDMLMNCIALESSIPLDDFSHVQRSVLNYGVPDIGMRTLDETTLTTLGGDIATALIAYEPRLLRQSIRVRRETRAGEDSLSVRFLVQAVLICDPQNLPVEFVADVEVQSGKIAVGRG